MAFLTCKIFVILRIRNEYSASSFQIKKLSTGYPILLTIFFVKTYYGFRNKIVLRRKYSKSKLAARLINVFLLVRQVAAAVLKSSYKGKRRAYIKAFIDGFRDAQIGKMGKNKKYMPQQGY